MSTAIKNQNFPAIMCELYPICDFGVFVFGETYQRLMFKACSVHFGFTFSSSVLFVYNKFMARSSNVISCTCLLLL